MDPRSRAVVDALVDGPALIYGLNTGLGHQRDERGAARDPPPYQELIVGGARGAIGEPLPAAVVRAAMAVRLNGHRPRRPGREPAGRPGAGGLLNAGVDPVVRATGSVGASDLMHMAAIAQVLIGTATPRSGARSCPAPQALAEAGLDPSCSSRRTAWR